MNDNTRYNRGNNRKVVVARNANLVLIVIKEKEKLFSSSSKLPHCTLMVIYSENGDANFKYALCRFNAWLAVGSWI